MTSIEEQLDFANARLLQASVDMCVKDEEIAALKAELAAKDQRIAALEGANRRAALPFRRDQTRRIGEDNERYRADMIGAGRGHLLR